MPLHVGNSEWSNTNDIYERNEQGQGWGNSESSSSVHSGRIGTSSMRLDGKRL